MKNLIFCMFSLLAVPVFAQDKTPAPVLNSEQKLKISNLELRGEVINLRNALLQQENAKLQLEANQFFQTLNVEGYTLKRQDDGSWIYVPLVDPSKLVK